MDAQQICSIVAQVAWAVFGAVCSVLVITWRLWLTTKYLREALAREMRSNFAKQRQQVIFSSKHSSNTIRSMLEIFLREPVPNLKDLVERTEREFQLRASERLSGVDDLETMKTQELNTRDFIPR